MTASFLGCCCALLRNRRVLATVSVNESQTLIKKLLQKNSEKMYSFQFWILLISLILFEMGMMIYLRVIYLELMDDIEIRLSRTINLCKNTLKYCESWDLLQSNVMIFDAFSREFS